jgi:hypothetical protein
MKTNMGLMRFIDPVVPIKILTMRHIRLLDQDLAEIRKYILSFMKPGAGEGHEIFRLLAEIRYTVGLKKENR